MHELYAGALGLLLIHQETGCQHSARHAMRLLERICDCADTDKYMRTLCERASSRLEGELSPWPRRFDA